MNGVIYQIVNKESGKKYIGSTTDPEGRKKRHFHESGTPELRLRSFRQDASCHMINTFFEWSENDMAENDSEDETTRRLFRNHEIEHIQKVGNAMFARPPSSDQYVVNLDRIPAARKRGQDLSGAFITLRNQAAHEQPALDFLCPPKVHSESETKWLYWSHGS